MAVTWMCPLGGNLSLWIIFRNENVFHFVKVLVSWDCCNESWLTSWLKVTQVLFQSRRTDVQNQGLAGPYSLWKAFEESLPIFLSLLVSEVPCIPGFVDTSHWSPSCLPKTFCVVSILHLPLLRLWRIPNHWISLVRIPSSWMLRPPRDKLIQFQVKTVKVSFPNKATLIDILV